MKWTPGPWLVVKDQAFHKLTVRGGVSAQFLAGCRDICGWREHKTGAKRGESPRWTGFDSEDEANANLIAAAPQLYEALDNLICPRCDTRIGCLVLSRAIVSTIDVNAQCRECGAARKALARARGEAEAT
jgi:rubredoxin